MDGVAPAKLASMPAVMERLALVRDYRLSSDSPGTQKLADTPTKFHVTNLPQGNSIIIPQTSTRRREYIPLGFVGPDVFCSNGVRLIPGGTKYHFGVLQSQMHMAWMRYTTGRLKDDYQYGGEVVYNTFIWPDIIGDRGRDQRIAVEEAAQQVLDARLGYSDCELEDLYDPDKSFLFPELTKAHRALDAAVEAAYGVQSRGDEQMLFEELFDRYRNSPVLAAEKKAAEEKEARKRKRAAVKR